MGDLEIFEMLLSILVRLEKANQYGAALQHVWNCMDQVKEQMFPLDLRRAEELINKRHG